MKKEIKELSNCCHAPVIVVGEETKYFVCLKCEHACDLKLNNSDNDQKFKVYDLAWPPSINHYYLNARNHGNVGQKRIMEPRTRKYHEDMFTYLLCQKKQDEILTCPLEAIVYIYPPDLRKRDDDNVQKAIWDVMQKSRIYRDDSQIKRKHTYWANVVEGGVIRVMLKPIIDELAIPEEFKIKNK